MARTLHGLGSTGPLSVELSIQQSNILDWLCWGLKKTYGVCAPMSRADCIIVARLLNNKASILENWGHDASHSNQDYFSTFMIVGGGPDYLTDPEMIKWMRDMAKFFDSINVLVVENESQPTQKIPGPHTCETCRKKNTCEERDRIECNFKEPCPNCLLEPICFAREKEMLARNDAGSKAWWEEIDARVFNCTREEQIPYWEHGHYFWMPANKETCASVKCPLWGGSKCTRHAEPCIMREGVEL